jgi:hypothetical protein
MAATLNLDDEADPLDLDEGTRRLVLAEDERGTLYEYVNVYGDATPILSARALNRAVWALEWVARERHPEATDLLWRRRQRDYTEALDNYIEAIRDDLQTPGVYPRREIEYPHSAEQKAPESRRYRRLRREAGNQAEEPDREPSPD